MLERFRMEEFSVDSCGKFSRDEFEKRNGEFRYQKNWDYWNVWGSGKLRWKWWNRRVEKDRRGRWKEPVFWQRVWQKWRRLVGREMPNYGGMWVRESLVSVLLIWQARIVEVCVMDASVEWWVCGQFFDDNDAVVDVPERELRGVSDGLVLVFFSTEKRESWCWWLIWIF